MPKLRTVTAEVEAAPVREPPLVLLRRNPRGGRGKRGQAGGRGRAGGAQGRAPNIPHRRPGMAAGHVARGRAWLECKARIRAGQEQAHGCAVPWRRKTVMSGAVVARLMSYA